LNGAERLVEEAVSRGVEICFANPGTTEMPMVAALDSVPGITAILGLHENVCTGAADGYARLAGKPALTILHLGPGLANGLANLHNARRARVPLINLVGEHASWHLSADAQLHSDIESWARPVSAFTRRIMSADEMARDMAEAHDSAVSGRGRISTLIVPHDHQLAPAQRRPFRVRGQKPMGPLDPNAIDQAAALLARCRQPLFLLGGTSLWGAGLEAAGRLASAHAATLAAEVSYGRLDTGQGLPPMARIPYFPEQAQAFIDRFDGVVVCGARLPVSFFGYHDKPSRYLDGKTDVVQIADQEDDAAGALIALAGECPAGDREAPLVPPPVPRSGPLDPEAIGRALTALMPEDAIAVVTAVSSAHAFAGMSGAARRHSQLVLTGGDIGDGPSMALGAAVAAPGRKVVNLEADGSAAYIIQALWSQAREALDVTTIICANQRYRILEIELERAGVGNPGPNARRLCSLHEPPLDWVSLAKGFGVPAVRVDDAGVFAEQLGRALAESGPRLIEAII